MTDIYNLKGRLENTKANLTNDKTISQKNKDLVNEYCNDKANGFFGQEIGKQRLVKLFCLCRQIIHKIDIDMDKITEEHIKKFLITLNETDYSEWTRADYKKLLKNWLRWLVEKKGLKVKFDFFNTTANKKKIHKLKREEMLEQDEVKKLIDTAPNLRDKCLIHMAWDLGARIGELGNIKIKDILFDNEGGATINLKGKTGERSPYIIESIPTITNWLSIHPDKHNKEAPLFVALTKEKKQLSYRGMYKVFRLTMENSSLDKKFNPHIFRHSRALWCAINNWNNQMANALFGWSDSSTMFSYYVSLGSKDLKNKMKSAYGEKEATETKQKKMIICKCGRKNDPNSDFCYKCGALLNQKKALEEERIVVTKDQFKTQLKTMLKQMIKSGDLKV